MLNSKCSQFFCFDVENNNKIDNYVVFFDSYSISVYSFNYLVYHINGFILVNSVDNKTEIVYNKAMQTVSSTDENGHYWG